MKSRTLFIMLLTLLLGVVGCNKQENGQVPETGVKDFTSSICKGTLRAEPEESGTFQAVEDGYLLMKHLNAVFNCCPGQLFVTVTMVGNEITINEDETEQGCKCVCPYDLSYKVGPLLTSKEYTIVLKQKGIIRARFNIRYAPGLSGNIQFQNVM